MSYPQIRFSIDRGGTFTDVYAEIPEDHQVYTEKLLSVDPANYSDAPREGIRRILENVLKIEIPVSSPVPTENILWIRMGTTVATNCLLERTGAPTGLAITKGFGDLLAIGDQTRPELFDLQIIKPDMLYSEILEIDERVRLLQNDENISAAEILTGKSGERFHVLKKPAPAQIRTGLQKMYDQGIRSLAVVCMHAYSVYDHELLIGSIAQDIGFEQISLSHQIVPQIKIVPRGDTCLVDAYLTPHIQQYLKSFQSGFQHQLKHTQLLFMQSDGGLSAASAFKGSNAILSGPAGGVVGCAQGAFPLVKRRPVIGFDMGGTSTDISRYHGSYELNHSSIIAGVRIQAPQMHIKTVAAGGGSRLFYRNGMLQVGPESAGAHPGPVCYRKNGYLSVTDANLFLGRLQADFFPKIFGPEENLPLDKKAVHLAFTHITAEINNDSLKKGLRIQTAEEIALGFLRVANETMIRPIREISVMRGYDIKEHVLCCFGGAGGQHACGIASTLGINTVFIHRHAGILSALGMSLAEIVVDKQESAANTLNDDSLPFLHKRLSTLEQTARIEFDRQCNEKTNVSITHYLNLRFQGTDSPMMIKFSLDNDPSHLFKKKYQQEYGFLLHGRNILVDDIRVRISGNAPKLPRTPLSLENNKLHSENTVQCYFQEGYQATPIYLLENLPMEHPLSGPAIIIQDGSTILIEPKQQAHSNTYGDIIITLQTTQEMQLATDVDPIQLSIFSNLFMSIGEQMGRTLQKTAISTNIKERLDFSCAVFDHNGDLVANAPHIPVHLGAMGEAVKQQILLHGNTLQEGDVLLSNHPASGGSHLPDFTVITPVWQKKSIVFFLASRGHHADIGGISPGSMPPFSTTLAEEGAAIRSLKIVTNNAFQEEAILNALTDFADPDHLPPIAPARHPADNISDIKAQIAANRIGIRLLKEMMTKYGISVVQAYMKHIQDNAEHAVRRMLKKLSRRQDNNSKLVLQHSDALDDGTVITLRIEIDNATGDAIFDFRGSGKEITGNLNCPQAVVRSAILYCLRCLIGEDIPLNQGCLTPVTVLTDSGSLLNPSETAAVVGGNVLTSQRITDVILKAFEAVADSQGCTNNLTFGNKDFGYYETIGGGAGAGPCWHGQSGVHTHMTNTRITDPEILEKRYPVLLQEFSLRPDSGGKGKYNGGDGLIRHIESLSSSPLQVSILSERRVLAPAGLHGGAHGKSGKNSAIKNNTETDIGGKNSLQLNKGDSIRIETPGGGGYGPPQINT